MAELLKQIWLKARPRTIRASRGWNKQTAGPQAAAVSSRSHALTARSQTHFPPALFSLHPLSSITSTPPCPPRFCAQELHGEQQRRRTECQPPDSRQGLLGVDGLRPPERRGVRVLFVRGKSKFIPLRTATQEKEDKKKQPNKQKKTTPHASWLLTVSQ